MQILTKIRKSTEQYVFTIYENDRLRLGIKKGDIILFIIETGEEFLRPIHKDFHVSLPVRLPLHKNVNQNYSVNIKNIFTKQQGLERSPNYFIENKVDIRYFIPLKTYSNKLIYIFPRDLQTSIIWYPVGGGAEPITLQNFIQIEQLGELLGFYFGDGSTSEGILTFRITNCEPSTLIHCLKILHQIGLPLEKFKVQIIYSTDKEITQAIQERCIHYWSSQLGFLPTQFVSVTKSNALSESLPFGSARIFFDNTTFVEVILRGLLKGIIPLIENPQCEQDFILLTAFLRGIFAAEGSVSCNGKRLSRLSLSFDPHSEEKTFYRLLLSHLGIKTSPDKRNEFEIYRRSSFKKFQQIDIFRFHESRNKKFQQGLINYKTSNRGK